jgi:hypothetical protein
MVGGNQGHELGGEIGEPVGENGALFFEVSSGWALSNGEAHWGLPFSREAWPGDSSVLTALDM